jgi:hypothetical protein
MMLNENGPKDCFICKDGIAVLENKDVITRRQDHIYIADRCRPGLIKSLVSIPIRPISESILTRYQHVYIVIHSTASIESTDDLFKRLNSKSIVIILSGFESDCGNAITTSKTAQSKPSPIIANFAMLGLLSLKVLLSKISYLNSINSIG